MVQDEVRKCSHDVMIPEDIEGDESPYCSGCRPATHMVKLWEHDEKDADDVQTTCCPICSSKEFEYKNAEEYSCPNCGYTQDDII